MASQLIDDFKSTYAEHFADASVLRPLELWAFYRFVRRVHRHMSELDARLEQLWRREMPRETQNLARKRALTPPPLRAMLCVLLVHEREKNLKPLRLLIGPEGLQPTVLKTLATASIPPLQSL